MDKFVKECFVKDVLHYQALRILKDIKIGDKVELKYDDKKPEEVRITVKETNQEANQEANQKDSQDGNTIGYLSKDDSKLIVDIINCRPDDNIFYGLISAVEQKNEENKRIKVVIFIKENKKAEEN